VKDLIGEYSLVFVLAYMRYIQKNAEQSVKEMLRELSIAKNLK
jgi:N-methylhydantoinase B/oxoprolinase/acetone carboxylase alpha subunit